MFEIKCGRRVVEVSSCIGMLCVRVNGKAYLVEHCSERGWLLRLGDMHPELFESITQAIEEYVFTYQQTVA